MFKVPKWFRHLSTIFQKWCRPCRSQDLVVSNLGFSFWKWDIGMYEKFTQLQTWHSYLSSGRTCPKKNNPLNLFSAICSDITAERGEEDLSWQSYCSSKWNSSCKIEWQQWILLQSFKFDSVAVWQSYKLKQSLWVVCVQTQEDNAACLSSDVVDYSLQPLSFFSKSFNSDELGPLTQQRKPQLGYSWVGKCCFQTKIFMTVTLHQSLHARLWKKNGP